MRYSALRFDVLKGTLATQAKYAEQHRLSETCVSMNPHVHCDGKGLSPDAHIQSRPEKNEDRIVSRSWAVTNPCPYIINRISYGMNLSHCSLRCWRVFPVGIA